MNGKETAPLLTKVFSKITISKNTFYFLLTKLVASSIDIKKIYLQILGFDGVGFEVVDIRLELKDY